MISDSIISSEMNVVDCTFKYTRWSPIKIVLMSFSLIYIYSCVISDMCTFDLLCTFILSSILIYFRRLHKLIFIICPFLILSKHIDIRKIIHVHHSFFYVNIRCHNLHFISNIISHIVLLHGVYKK